MSPTPDEPAAPARQALEAAMAALESQRATLGDDFVDTALAPLRRRLEAMQASRPVLRQVTIVFLDIVGSTRLGQRLDPEDIQAVVDGALARFTALVAAHGGRTLQYAGDNLLAAFGADGAREDDAERAVRCALALRDAGADIGRDVQRQHGVEGFDVRLGVHTGGVLLGGGVDGDGSIRGSAVNVAARMEQSAPAAGVRISLDTHALVRGLFEVEPQPALQVKGVDEAVGSVLVRAAHPAGAEAPRRGLAGMHTPLVGREAERAMLQHSWHAACSGQGAALLLLVGEAGLGKSRLLLEFEAVLTKPDSAPTRWSARAQPYGEHRPFGLLRTLLYNGLGLEEPGNASAASKDREHFDAALALRLVHRPVDEVEAHVHLLGHLLGVDHADSAHVRGIRHDGAQVRQRGLHALGLMFQGLAARGPLLLALEDLHWADSASLEALAGLPPLLGDAPVLLVGTARPDLAVRWPAMAEPTTARTLQLLPLDEGASQKLVTALLKHLPHPSEALTQVLLSGAEGNPFYMEELLRMLIDRGAIDTRGPQWQLDPARLDAVPVPPTLTGVLQAQLDALPADERQALQQASVIGAVFWDRALAALDESAARLLPAHVRRALVRPSAATPTAHGREFAFRHHLLHQVTYETVLKRVRREWHARVAQWLATQAETSGAWGGVIALHHERAGDAGLAAASHADAASYAAERFAHDAALEHAARALGCLEQAELPADEVVALRWRVQRLRERTLDLLGRRDEQAAALDAMEALADAQGDDGMRAHTARRRADRAMRRGDWAGSEAAARRAIDSAARAGDDAIRLMSVFHLATSLAARGQYGECDRLAQTGADEARALGLLREQAFLLGALGFSASRRGAQHLCLLYEQQVTPMLRELGDRRNEAISLSNQAVYWRSVGRFDDAARTYHQALELARANGDRVILLSIQLALAHVEFERTPPELGSTTPYAELLQMAERIDARDMVVEIRHRLVLQHLARGELAKAREVNALALPEAERVDPTLLANLLAVQALIEACDGHRAASEALVGRLLGDGVTPLWEDAAEPLEAACALSELLLDWGDARATPLLARARTLLDERAAALPEADRTPFLQAIHAHRRLVAWTAAGRADP